MIVHRRRWRLPLRTWQIRHWNISKSKMTTIRDETDKGFFLFVGSTERSFARLLKCYSPDAVVARREEPRETVFRRIKGKSSFRGISVDVPMPGLRHRSLSDPRSSPISGPCHPRSFRILFSCLRILLAAHAMSTNTRFSHFRTFAKQSQKQIIDDPVHKVHLRTIVSFFFQRNPDRTVSKVSVRLR